MNKNSDNFMDSWFDSQCEVCNFYNFSNLYDLGKYISTISFFLGGWGGGGWRRGVERNVCQNILHQIIQHKK